MSPALRIYALSLVLALSSSLALAQRADRPDVRVGDQWSFVQYWGTPSTAPNRIWEILAVTPEGIKGAENGESLELTPDLGVLDSPRTRDSNPKSLSFPLEVGKRWHYSTDWAFKVKGSKGSAVVEVVVVGHERLKILAGEFDVFKLEAKASIRGLSAINSQIDAETETTYWYSPAARAVVKWVNRNPYLGTSTVELVALRLKP